VDTGVREEALPEGCFHDNISGVRIIEWCVRVEFEDTLKKIIERGPEQAVTDWMTQIEDEYGVVPLIFQRMAERPEVLLSHLMYKNAVTETSSIEPKFVELISLAVSAALNCSHCLEYHLKGALTKGATREEILEVILIAGTLAQSSVLADAYRVVNGTVPACGATCDLNSVKLSNAKEQK
jgi:AhpD family alkylhydroperoxidase